MLVQALLQGVSNGLGGYIGTRTPAFQLGQQIHQIALDLDGSADVIVSGALTRAGGAGGALWTGPCAPEAGHIGEGKGISNPLRRAKAIGAGLDWRADVAGRMLTMRWPIQRGVS